MTQFAKNYVVISPVRDEEAYLRFTIESMLAQTVRPIEWIIVNDGSTDNTAAIIDEYASQHCWIRAVHRLNRGFRKAGGGVVEAFNDGYHALSTDNWQFIVKLDGDLTFEPDYFEKCLNNFQRDPHLGIGGGVICYIEKWRKTDRVLSRVPCSWCHENLSPRLLGGDRRILAGSWMGHNGRS